MTPPAVRDASWTPTIEQGVEGSRGESGMLLRAPPNETLAWDLDMEIVSNRYRWIEERQAWWIASSYFETVVSIVLRSFGSVMVIGLDQDRLLSRDGRVDLQVRLL